MKKILCFILLISSFCQAQQPIFQERVYFLSPKAKVFKAITSTRQGNVILSGPMSLGASWGNNIYMLITPNLDTIWTKQGASLTGANIAQDIRQTWDNGFIFAGNTISTVSPTTNQNIILLQKLDGNGSILWTKTYSTALGTTKSILELTDRGFLINSPYYNGQGVFIKTDASGNILWQKRNDRGGKDNLIRSEFTYNGNIVSIGITQHSFPANHIRAYLTNIYGDSIKGNSLVVNGFNREELVGFSNGGVLSLSDGGFLINGGVDTTTISGGNSLGMLVKINSNLQVVWKYVWRNNPHVVRWFVKPIELTDGSIVVLAHDKAPVSNQFYIYRFSPSGQIMNLYNFQSNVGTLLEDISTFSTFSDSSFAIGGMSSNNVTGNFGLYVAKVKIPGLPLPLPPITVTSIKPELAANDASLGQSYPNPTPASANISYTLPLHYIKASILIREMATGREIRRYELKRNSSSLSVDLSQLCNGLYLYSLVVDEQPVGTRKLAVLK